MKQYAGVMRRNGMDVEQMAGAGAAGGLGAALCGYLHANLKSGIETVLDLMDFDSLLEGTDLVVRLSPGRRSCMQRPRTEPSVWCAPE